jgi:hypothetical protein
MRLLCLTISQILFSEPAYYYDFADAALVLIDAADIAEGQELISVKDFCSYLEGKGYSPDRCKLFCNLCPHVHCVSIRFSASFPFA